MLLLHFSPVTPSFFIPPPLVTGQFYVKVRYETKLYCFVRYLKNDVLKGLLHEIFWPFYWPVWMHLGPNKNRFWFLHFEEAPSIWGSHFKFWCISVQTFSGILRISGKDWQLRTQLPILLRELGTLLPILLREWGLSCQSFSEILWFFEKSVHPKQRFWENRLQKSTKIGDSQAQLPILLQDSKNLGECLAWNVSKLKIII